MVRRVLITVGGTGGHIYPAIALARHLKERYPDIYIVFAGGGLKENRFFDQQAFPYHEIACGYFPLKHPLRCLKSLGRVASGLWQSQKVIKDVKPDIIIGFGSYHSLPTLLSAKMHSIPIILHEANTIPGKVNRLLSRHALATMLHFSQTSQYLKGKTIPVGMPLRENMVKDDAARSECFDYFGLDPAKKTLLIFGGSQGACAINTLMARVLEHYPGSSQKFQIIHITGYPKETEAMERFYKERNLSARVKDFETSLDKAWNLAVLFIGRAGAGAIAEAIEYEVPGILVPYPHAADDHQNKNADFMVDTVGGALKYEENAADPKHIAEQIFYLLEGEPDRLARMKKSVSQYKNALHNYDMCSLIYELME